MRPKPGIRPASDPPTRVSNRRRRLGPSDPLVDLPLEMQGLRQDLYRLPAVSFAAKGRRYTLDTIQQFAHAYLNSKTSYGDTCCEGGRKIVYDDRTPSAKSSPLAQRGAALARSTIWRWLRFLGSMPETVAEMMRLVRERQPASQLHRHPWHVAPSRYRSEARKQVLQEALKWLVVAKSFCETFARAGSEVNSTNLATVLSWR